VVAPGSAGSRRSDLDGDDVTILLFAVSSLGADGTLSHSALRAMLPFAGILAIDAA
jgi:hypothetical protein